MAGIMAGLGVATGIAGGILSGIGANKRRNAYPRYMPLYPGQEQQTAIGGNIAALPGAEDLATRVDIFNQAELERMLQLAIPGYKGIQSDISDVIGSEVRGEIPKDVQEQIQRSGAAAAVAGGTAGSDFAAKRTLRDLGLTSLDITQRGITNAQSWMRNSAALAMPQTFNLASMFLTPQQQMTFDAQQHLLQFENQLGRWSLPNSQEIWGAELSQMGGQLTGLGMGGMGGGLGGLFGGGGRGGLAGLGGPGGGPGFADPSAFRWWQSGSEASGSGMPPFSMG